MVGRARAGARRGCLSRERGVGSRWGVETLGALLICHETGLRKGGERKGTLNVALSEGGRTRLGSEGWR